MPCQIDLILLHKGANDRFIVSVAVGGRHLHFLLSFFKRGLLIFFLFWTFEKVQLVQDGQLKSTVGTYFYQTEAHIPYETKRLGLRSSPTYWLWYLYLIIFINLYNSLASDWIRDSAFIHRMWGKYTSSHASPIKSPSFTECSIATTSSKSQEISTLTLSRKYFSFWINICLFESIWVILNQFESFVVNLDQINFNDL